MKSTSKPSANAAEFDVAVVGGGVVGLAAALGCAQCGLTVALIAPQRISANVSSSTAPSASRSAARSDTRAATPDSFDPRIYALARASIDLLTRLKVWHQVDASRTQAVARMRVFGDAGNELTFDAYGAAVERLATIVEERELVRVLASACDFTPGITRIPVALAALTTDDAAAHLRLADERALAARLVIGADGATSFVRAACGINSREHSYEQSAVVANFNCETAHNATAFQWFSNQGVLALLPLPGKRVSLVWSAPQVLAQQLVDCAGMPDDGVKDYVDADAGSGRAGLAQRVSERTGAVVGALSSDGPAHAFALRGLAVDRLIAARAALVGDAAHVVHPLAGQGLNLGLQDVATLLSVLQERAANERHRDPGDQVLLRRYARARAEPIGLMRVTIDGLARLFGSDDRVLRGVRNTGLSLVNAMGPLKRALIRQALG